MSDDEKDLERALAAVERDARRERPPALSRHDARALLIPLGRLALARGADAVRAHVERIGKAVAGRSAGWRAAVQEELALACAEHVQGTDARYLHLPGFDWPYVLHARERLEARVVAARLCGEEPPPALWSAVAAADRRVREHRPDAPGADGRS